MIEKGYKYVYWNISNNNADIYIDKAEKQEILSSDELDNARGCLDKKEMEGIYFCKSLDDMFIWLQEACDWDRQMDGIELLEVIPLTDVKEKVYDFYDGRIAYVTDKCKVRVLTESEIPNHINDFINEYFEGNFKI